MKSNKETIKQKIEVIERNISHLEDQSSKEDSYMEIQATKHCLLEIIEASIDISSHIIASEGYRRPESYSEGFRTLEEKNVLEEELGRRLGEMAGLRNVLVHRYEDIEPEKLQKFIREDMEDLKRFIDDVYGYMSE